MGNRYTRTPKNRPIYEITYSDNKKFLSHHKKKIGKASGEAGEMGLKIKKVKKLKKPSTWDKFRAYGE